jgi:hypothetical protein
MLIRKQWGMVAMIVVVVMTMIMVMPMVVMRMCMGVPMAMAPVIMASMAMVPETRHSNQIDCQSKTTNHEKFHEPLRLAAFRKPLCCLDHNLNAYQPKEGQQECSHPAESAPTSKTPRFQTPIDSRFSQTHMGTVR